MPDLIEYFLETSNDEKLPFLESIEAMSRSHRDDSRFSDPVSFSDFSFTSNNPVINYDEASIYTDCDLNILVDPKTGEQLLDTHPWSPMLTDNPLSSTSSSSRIFPDEDSSEIKLDDSPPPATVVNPQEDARKERVVLIQLSPSYIPALQRSDQTSHVKHSKVTTTTSSHPSHAITITPQRISPLTTSSSALTTTNSTKSTSNKNKPDKPPFSYSCLIAMALKDSAKGYLPVSDIYNYIINRFPYFKSAPDGWKNSIRHNLSLNKSFQKLETPSLNGSQRKACLWGLSDSKMSRFDEEIAKCSRKADADISCKLMNDKFLDDDLLLGEEFSASPPTPFHSPTRVDNSHKDLTYYRVVKFPKNSHEFSFDDLLDHNDFKSFSIPLNNNNNNKTTTTNNNHNNNKRTAFRTIISNDSPVSLKAVQASA